MKRWIDAEWLNNKMGEINMDIYTDEVKEYIAKAPSINIVQCKECMHGSDNKVYGCLLIDFNTDGYHRMYADDFCSCGEDER